jgi:hypothetical protein
LINQLQPKEKALHMPAASVGEDYSLRQPGLSAKAAYAYDPQLVLLQRKGMSR